MGDELIRYSSPTQSGSEHHSFDLGSFLLGLGIGAIFLGAIIWTRLGRTLTIKAVSKAYKIGEEEIRKRVGE